MREFGSGWSGLKEYAVKVGVATVDDTDDIVAAKVKAVIQGTLPEEQVEQTPPTVAERFAAAVKLRDDDGEEDDSSS